MERGEKMFYANYDQINHLISMEEVMSEIENYYLAEENNAVIPERMFIQDGENTAILKPSLYENYYAVKLVGIVPSNAQRNEPTLKGTVLLNRRNDMEPLGMFDARSITALRTGALCGLSIKYLTDKRTSTLGIIGTGEQGWSHLQAALAVRPIKDIYVHNRSSERLNAFITKIHLNYKNINVRKVTRDELVVKSGIIVVTTTSDTPVIPFNNGMDMTGKHIAASGAFKPDMQEIPDEILKEADRIFVDTYAAFKESKDMLQAKKFGRGEAEVLDLQGLVNLGEAAYINNNFTIFKSVGHSIYDLLTAKLIYEKLTLKSKNSKYNPYTLFDTF